MGVHRKVILALWKENYPERAVRLSVDDRTWIEMLERFSEKTVTAGIRRHPEWKKIHQHARWVQGGRVGIAACGCTNRPPKDPPFRPEPDPRPKPHPGPTSYSQHRIGDIKSPPRGGISRSGF